jgi:hypothetical protein
MERRFGEGGTVDCCGLDFSRLEGREEGEGEDETAASCRRDWTAGCVEKKIRQVEGDRALLLDAYEAVW